MGADKLIDLAYGRDKTLEETFHTNLYRATGFLSKYDVDQMGRDGKVHIACRFGKLARADQAG